MRLTKILPIYDDGALSARLTMMETAITQNSAAIELRASKWEYDALSGRVSSAEADLNIQAGLIESKVSEDGIMSAISQSPESIKIAANKIQITGTDGIVNAINNSEVTISANRIKITGTDGIVSAINNSPSTVEINANRIKIAGTGGIVDAINGSEATIDANHIELTAANVVDAVNAAGEGAIQEAKISLSGSNLINKINESTITINASRVNLQGYITATNLRTAGQTVINGSNITTGVLNADLITSGHMTADIIRGGELELGGEYGGWITVKSETGTVLATVSNEGFVADHSTIGNFLIHDDVIGGNYFTASEVGISLRAPGSSTQRTSISTAGAAWYDASHNMLMRMTTGEGFGMYDTSGVRRVYVNKSEISLVNASGVQRFQASSSGAVTCVSLTQTSKAEFKTNIKPYDDPDAEVSAPALDLVRDTEIYEYNLIEEMDDGRKHYGVIIDGGYICCDEIKDTNGVDLYSMVSILWQAVKELEERCKHE